MPPGAAVDPEPVSSETTKQVKCCGDTPVRHTGVVGFNSHHLLDPMCLLRRLCGRTETHGEFRPS